MNPWPKSWAWRALAFVGLAAPHAVFLALAIVLWPVARWKPAVVSGCLELVALKGPLVRWFRRHNWAGGTVGVCRVLWVEPDNRLRSHEVRHSRQWMPLGPLFGVVWLILVVAFGYEDSPFEVDATAHEVP